MKKAILYSMVMSLIFFSCKKDHSPIQNPTEKTYSVKFNVSGFTEQIVNSTGGKQTNSLQTNSVSIPTAGYLTILYYYVFDNNGNFLHKITQDSTTTNFGSISDDLPSGTYTVVIAAGKAGFSSPSNVQAAISAHLITYSPNTAAPKAWQDTFYGTFPLTVSGGSVSQAVTLSRIVGELEININDAIPANVASISVSLDQEDLQYNFATNKAAYPATVVKTITIPASEIGKTNFQGYTIVANTLTPFTVTITSYDASKHVVSAAIVDGVSCQVNTRTILSGSLFGSNNSFNVTLNTGWGTPIQIPFATVQN